MRKYFATFAVVLLAAFALGACGGDDDKDAVTAGTNASQDDNSSDDTSADDNSSDDTASDDDTEDDSDDGGALSASKCAEIAENMSKASASATAGLSADADDLDTSLQQFEAYVEAAPDEIKDDMRKMAEGYREYVEIFKEAGLGSGKTPTADAIEKLTEASQKIASSDFQAASERVSKWFEEKCGG